MKHSHKRSKMTMAILALVSLGVAAFLWADNKAKSTRQLAEQQLQSNIGLGTLGENPAGGHWKDFSKPGEKKLKKQLTALQYKVTQKGATEPAFDNPYYDHYKRHRGIYVDVVSGEPLFSTRNQYASGTGWPSFTKPLEPSNVVTKIDYKLMYPRTAVLSRHAGSHLGHVFEDGPTNRDEARGAEPTGLRYCLNSAALQFIPAKELEEKGYGEYVSLFEEE